MSFFIFFIFLVLVVIAIGVFGGRGYQRETLDRMRDIDGRLRRNEETLASLAGLLARLFVPPAETAIQQVKALGYSPEDVRHLLLTHLDREVISPFELLNVSGFRPHQLTHQFITGNGAFTHRVPWFDEDLNNGNSHRLYRLFAFLDVEDRMTGVSPSRRRRDAVRKCRNPRLCRTDAGWAPSRWSRHH